MRERKEKKSMVTMNKKEKERIEENSNDAGFSSLMMVFAIFINIFVTAGMLYAYDTWYAQKVVTLDLDAKIKVLRQDFLEKKIDVKELERKIKTLKTGVNSIADRRVIIKREAIIAGGEDVTEELR